MGSVMNAEIQLTLAMAVKAIGQRIVGWVDNKAMLADGSLLSYDNIGADVVGRALNLSCSTSNTADGSLFMSFEFNVNGQVDGFSLTISSESTIDAAEQLVVQKVFNFAKTIGLELDKTEKLEAYHKIEAIVGNEMLSPSATVEAVENVVTMAARWSALCDKNTVLSKLSPDDVLLVRMPNEAINALGSHVLGAIEKALPKSNHAVVFSDVFNVDTLPIDDMRKAGWVRATTAAKWRDDGKPDPHSNIYNVERGALSMGHLTDDQLANEVYLYNHRSGPQSMAYLTAMKDRIRWLSRKLSERGA